MKIRLDFVTNSSSSSYICSFAKIENEELAKKIIDEFGLRIVSGEEILADAWGEYEGAEFAGVYIDLANVKRDSMYIYYEDFKGNDSDFWVEEGGYYNYDIDYDFFSISTRNTIEAINEKNGFSEIQSGYGAGRNG